MLIKKAKINIRFLLSIFIIQATLAFSQQQKDSSIIVNTDSLQHDSSSADIKADTLSVTATDSSKKIRLYYIRFL